MEDGQHSIVIRKATHSDAPAILELVKEHLKESIYSWLPVDDRKILDATSWFIEQDPHNAYLIVADLDETLVGLIACVSIPLTFTNNRVSGELLWLVKKEYRGSMLGVKLLKYLEEWSHKTNHEAIQVGSNDIRTHKLLETLGYKEKARTYIKVTNGC